jgi:SpoVK/Ycf46/Vps4 family AAA+-type ATPase/tetratricopeptide (TPR) repeat protein
MGLNLHQEDIEELLNEAYGHLQSGRYRMALTAAKNAYEIKPDDFRILNCLAWATLENGNPAQALEYANLAVKISKDDIDARLYRGFLLMRMSIFEGAISDLDYAIEHNTSSLSWAYLNKARSLAGLGRYFEGLEEVEKAIHADDGENLKLIVVRNWFRKTLGYEQSFFSELFQKKKTLLEDAEEALKQREFWFSLWAARETLNTPSLKKEHSHANLIELEALLGMFRIKPALEKAEAVKSFLGDDARFRNVYQRLIKLNSHDKTEPREEILSVQEKTKKYDFEKYEHKLFNVINARTYDVLENNRSGKRTFLLQFNEETIRYVGLEIIVDNPFFKNKNIEIEGMAVWHLNSVIVGKHQFNLFIEKSWKYIEFIQSWGTDSPGFWQSGQGKVDIYLSNELMCSRWFTIGNSDTVNIEESDILFDEVDQPVGINAGAIAETPLISQHSEIKEYSVNPPEEKSLDELLTELNGLVGLESVKQSMNDFVSYLGFIQERKKSGLKTQGLLINCVFTGKPGTGKTMVARLLGKIFKQMGILKNGHVIEVDRSGLVGQFIGETAQKTEKVINEALGGLLFIDEAYTLKKPGSQQDFGQEAIDTLLKRMEDKSGEFVVIAAGYPEEMNEFINSNPGFKSRFTHFFNFEDYTPDELVEIFKQAADKEEYRIKDDALEILKKEFTALFRKRDKTFGNARLVRNYFNDAKIQLSKRYLKTPEKEKTQEAMTTIYPEDIISLQKSRTTKDAKIGIDEDNLQKGLAKLNSLTGLYSVKKEINEIIKLARFYVEQGEDINNKFSSHLIFLGNPGTGKTTVARLFSEIYSALGILPRGHLVEVDRQGLVGSYVGQTAEKTKDLIDKSLGGTLFIDEAYSLVKAEDDSSDFGKEAIDALLKRMEDDRGKFIVIAAGYTDEMNKFLNSNPGLQSRFNRIIYFEDYTPEELFSIAEKLFSEKEKQLDNETKEQLLKYFNRIYRSRTKNFGNGRVVRNLVESALKNHLLRIADLPSSERKGSDLKTIKLDDLKDLISPKKEKEIVKVQGDPELLDSYLKELNALVGLDSVKKSVDKLVSSLKVAKLREQRGMKVIPKNLHSVFTGNPGTGKTTIARLLSKIYKEMGILEKGHLVEVDRSALVAGYQGQTAAKTDVVIKSAIGGTLFIDEAYTLSRSSNDFGQEAIDTLIKRMEDQQGKFIVIVAGYTNEMREFIDSNPGLVSRFTNYFSFEDFTQRQMLEIANIISEKNGYKLDEGAWQLLLDIFTELYGKRDKNFGNARTVRNILYKAISNQEERILTLVEPTDEDLCTISFEDVDKISLDEL